MNYIYEYFNNESVIVITTPDPDVFTNWRDILCMIVKTYPKVIPSYIIVSNKLDNHAIIVGDNIHVTGTVSVLFKKI